MNKNFSKEETWPASRVELWPLSKIKPYDKNPRTHPEEQIELLAAAMEQEGVTAPVLVDEDGVIIYGHGRRLAAMRNRYKQYPVVIARGWTEGQKRAARIKDNQLGLLSGWNMPLLREEAVELKTAGYDLPLLGFTDKMTEWLTSAGDLVTDPNAEWSGMPHFNNPDARAFRSIVVHFNDQEAVDAFAKVTNQNITDKTRFLWYPEIIIKPFVKYTGSDGKKPAEAEKPAAAKPARAESTPKKAKKKGSAK